VRCREGVDEGMFHGSVKEGYLNWRNRGEEKVADENGEEEEEEVEEEVEQEEEKEEDGHTKRPLINTATDKETQSCSKKNHLMYLLVFLFGLTAFGQVTCT